MRGGNERPAAPAALGITGLTVSGPLGQAPYAIAREQSDEAIESAALGVWAGLDRDAEAAADRVPEMSLAGDAEIRPEEIDAGAQQRDAGAPTVRTAESGGAPI